MLAPDRTEQLPDEILLKVFDLLTLSDLALFSGISRRWRTVVGSHPTYFARPALESASPGAVAFFVSQVTCTRGKSWDVAVAVHEPFTALETAVLPAIASRLDDVELLTLDVHFSQAQAVFDLLRGSAVSLRRLQLYFQGRVAVPVPGDILSRAAPGRGLQSLILLDVDVPEDIPTALQTLPNLVFGKKARDSRMTLHALANAFPAARDITLTDRALPGSVAVSDWPDAWQNLESLMLTVGRRRVRRALRCLPLSRIMHLTTMHTDHKALQYSLSHLSGSLDMCIKNIGWGRFVIHLTSRPSRLMRSFYEFTEDWSPPRALQHDLLSIEAVMDRVLSLSIPAALWALVTPRMTQCSSITHLTLLLSDPEWLSLIIGDEQQPMDCTFPNVRSLTLASETGTLVVTAEDVTSFVLKRLLPHSPPDVRIQGVDWVGQTAFCRPSLLFRSLTSGNCIQRRRGMYNGIPSPRYILWAFIS